MPSIVSAARQNKEALSYGPVYFVLNSFIYHLFGSGIYQARILTLIAGFALTVLLWKASKQIPILWAALFMLTDPFFSNAMHEGRMEILALMFAFGAVLFCEKKGGISYLFAAFLMALAMLTTPRIIIVLIPFLAIKLQELQKKEIKWISFTIFLLVLIVSYMIWIYWAFGSIHDWLAYYKTVLRGNNEAPHGYLGGNFYIPKHEYLLLFFTLLFIVVGIMKYRKKYFTKHIFLALATILLFYIFIYDWGVYSVLIIPFFYLIIFHGFNALLTKRAAMYFAILLVLFNLTYQGLKISMVLKTRKQRDPKAVTDFLHKYVPEGTKVAGSSLVYYQFIGRNPFQLYDKYLTDKERATTLAEKYNFQYLVIATEEWQSPAAQTFLTHLDLQQVAAFSNEKCESDFVLSEINACGYNVYIYKRKGI